MTAQKLRIGILRLLDCAPVVIAASHGGFAEAGIAAEIAIEPSWANIADKLAYGLLDAAVILGPLALAMTLGLRGRATKLRLVATLSREGNAIALDQHLACAPDLAAALREQPDARFAVVHAYSSHDLLLRPWLAARGFHPTAENIVALPPAAMGEALARGAIQGFCAGAPWGALAAREGRGAVVATSAALAPGHPEKLVVLREDFAVAHPMAAAALRDALGTATALCRLPERRAELASLLARPESLDLPEPVLAEALVAREGNPVFMTGAALRPRRADLDWIIDRMAEANLLAGIDRHSAATVLRAEA